MRAYYVCHKFTDKHKAFLANSEDDAILMGSNYFDIPSSDLFAYPAIPKRSELKDINQKIALIRTNMEKNK